MSTFILERSGLPKTTNMTTVILERSGLPKTTNMSTVILERSGLPKTTYGYFRKEWTTKDYVRLF